MNRFDTIACIADVVTKIITSEDKISLRSLDLDIKKLKTLLLMMIIRTFLRCMLK